MNVTQYRGANDGRGPSPNLWHNARIVETYMNPNLGVHLFEDWINPPTFATTVSQLGWYPFIGAGCAIAGVTGLGGLLRVSLAATDNIEAALTFGHNTSAAFELSSTSPRAFWLEARVRFTQTAESGFFFGMTEAGLAATGTLANNTGALADKDFVGWHVPMHATDAVASAVYREEGETAVAVKADALTVTAGQWYKLGLYYGGRNKQLAYYLNGTPVAQTSLASAVNFPDGEALTPLIFAKAGEASAKTFDLDWVRIAQAA